VTHPVIERGCLYRFFDVEDVLLYVGITRDLSARFASHRRRAAWWLDAVRIEVAFYESMAAAEAAEAVAIITERPLHNAAQPTPARVCTLHERAGVSADSGVLRATAEAERLRHVVDEQGIGLAKMQGNVDAARGAYRTMRAKCLAVDAERARWARKFFDAVAPRPDVDFAPVVSTGDWGEL